MKPARRHAFTLVELLVASAAAGLAMIAAAAAISAALRSFASVSASGDDGTRRVLMLAALEQDLASAMPLGGSSFAGCSNETSVLRQGSSGLRQVLVPATKAPRRAGSLLPEVRFAAAG